MSPWNDTGSVTGRSQPTSSAVSDKHHCASLTRWTLCTLSVWHKFTRGQHRYTWLRRDIKLYVDATVVCSSVKYELSRASRQRILTVPVSIYGCWTLLEILEICWNYFSYWKSWKSFGNFAKSGNFRAEFVCSYSTVTVSDGWMTLWHASDEACHHMLLHLS